ncbi:hypothetical protein BD626DRAFT_235660 [Schizophyllum amplum]|uniref:Uncharacterized protein n=1 Tax=Schizophyllum amplum TaxID=97359 RepID=A0A550CJ37_9AGAR|nr:hypothetical protein BD626DRAFT_235660 [Auriculariopsis ampla]
MPRCDAKFPTEVPTPPRLHCDALQPACAQVYKTPALLLVSVNACSICSVVISSVLLPTSLRRLPSAASSDRNLCSSLYPTSDTRLPCLIPSSSNSGCRAGEKAGALKISFTVAACSACACRAAGICGVFTYVRLSSGLEDWTTRHCDHCLPMTDIECSSFKYHGVRHVARNTPERRSKDYARCHYAPTTHVRRQYCQTRFLVSPRHQVHHSVLECAVRLQTDSPLLSLALPRVQCLPFFQNLSHAGPRSARVHCLRRNRLAGSQSGGHST